MKALYALMIAALALPVAGRSADADEAAVAKLVDASKAALLELASNKDIVAETKARNTKLLDAEATKAMQAKWTAADQSDPSYAKEYLENKSVDAIKAAQAKIKGLSRTFICDKSGNVCASLPKAKDFIHGFEGKFTKAMASGKLEVNKPTADKITKKWSVQLSVPIKDGSDTIGVLVATFPLE